MNSNYKKVPTRFGPQTRFEVKPAPPPPPYRAAQEARFEDLKNRLLLDWLEANVDTRLNGYLRRAANEAAALAWVTPYPLLVFPALFEEKAETVHVRAARQKQVCRKSRELLTV